MARGVAVLVRRGTTVAGRFGHATSIEATSIATSGRSLPSGIRAKLDWAP